MLLRDEYRVKSHQKIWMRLWDNATKVPVSLQGQTYISMKRNRSRETRRTTCKNIFKQRDNCSKHDISTAENADDKIFRTPS
jgi:hypothetical protein